MAAIAASNDKGLSGIDPALLVKVRVSFSSPQIGFGITHPFNPQIRRQESAVSQDEEVCTLQPQYQ
jgi:hypothetical protein